MALDRSGGVLLHVTSLPGPYGIGEFGAPAYAFVDWLASAGQRYWQMMPLAPTGYGDSPYQAFSAFAGNPYLISVDALREDGLLQDADLNDLPAFDDTRVDYALQFQWRHELLHKAFQRFQTHAPEALAREAEAFREREAAWLTDYALFMALKDAHDGQPWNAWAPDIRRREPAAMQRWAAQLQAETEYYAFVQWLFFRQWDALHAHARARGVQVIGDIPIFVALDSADAWANQPQFCFDEDGQPTIVAGVPPDFFSETGQLWGNPLYRWDAMQQDGFQWWIARFRANLRLYDVLRIDHFRGFDAYWAVPAQEETAVNGEWLDAPGHALFRAVLKALGDLPIIAEDLGLITPTVEALRDDFQFPGMAVLQFAFGGGDWSESDYLPENIQENRVVYTGTHDNDTTRGWWLSLGAEERAHVLTYLPKAKEDTIAPQLVELAWASRARTAVVPLQDLLNLGTEARMNLPGTLGERNWTWRASADDFTQQRALDLRRLTEQYHRMPQTPQVRDRSA